MVMGGEFRIIEGTHGPLAIWVPKERPERWSRGQMVAFVFLSCAGLWALLIGAVDIVARLFAPGP